MAIAVRSGAGRRRWTKLGEWMKGSQVKTVVSQFEFRLSIQSGPSPMLRSID